MGRGWWRWRSVKQLDTKWFSTVASIWIQCTSGSMYTFSVYSSTLKSTQGYDQSTLDTISVFKDIGANTGVLAGLLYTAATSSDASRRGGPWVVHLVGSVQSFVGYFMMWTAVSGVIRRPPVALMCLFMIVTAHGQTFFNTADVVTSVRNFTGYSGTAVGIMKGFLGLSGAILIQVYQTIFEDRPTAFLLLLALLTSINPLLLMSFVRIYNANEVDDKKYLDNFSLISLIVAAYLMIIIIVEKVLSFQLVVRIIAFVLLLVLILLPLIVAIRAGAKDPDAFHEEYQVVGEANMLESSPTEYHPLAGDAEDDADAVENKSLQVTEDRNLLQAMQTLDFWILFFAMACGMGSGLATINNMSQVGESLGYSTLETTTLISLLSIWNFLGRFGAGYTTDYFLRVRGLARPLFMAITLAGLCIGHIVIASGLPGALYAGSVLVGIFYGSQWSLMPTISSEIFGVRHMGTIFNTITIANPVGSYIFSVRVIGFIYDKEASGEGNTCTGTHCFFLSFMIMASATLLGSLAALGLFFRTKSYYSRVILRRLMHGGV